MTRIFQSEAILQTYPRPWMPPRGWIRGGGWLSRPRHAYRSCGIQLRPWSIRVEWNGRTREAGNREAGGEGEFKNCETPPIIIRRNSFVILMKKEGRFHNDSWKFPVAFINFALHALRNTKNELTLAEITRAPHAFRSRFLSSPTPFRACSPLLPNGESNRRDFAETYRSIDQFASEAAKWTVKRLVCCYRLHWWLTWTLTVVICGDNYTVGW